MGHILQFYLIFSKVLWVLQDRLKNNDNSQGIILDSTNSQKIIQNSSSSQTNHKNKVLAVRNCYKAYTIKNKVIAGERND